jgi:rhodanese-related sulfurtransferase
VTVDASRGGNVAPKEEAMSVERTGEPFERVDAARGKALLDEGSVTLVDVREPAEWSQGRIAGALLVPLNQLLISPRQHLSGDGVLFYCAQGIRSAVACEVAAAVGVARIYNLEGGIQEWAAQGYPIES